MAGSFQDSKPVFSGHVGRDPICPRRSGAGQRVTAASITTSEGGDGVEVIVRGTTEEIAALVVAIQERHGLEVSMDSKNLAQAICDRGQGAPEQSCN